MRGLFLAAAVVGLAVGGLVAGVRACGGGSEDQPEPADPGSPRGAAEAFATTWTNGDIAGLYLLLNAQSQSTYPVAAFQEAMQELQPQFRHCPRCTSWVDQQCWIDARGLCPAEAFSQFGLVVQAGLQRSELRGLARLESAPW